MAKKRGGFTIPPKNEKWRPTPEQLKVIKESAAIRLPIVQIATLLGISHDTLQRACVYDDATRASMEMGRTKASRKIRKTLFNMATKDKNFQALRFWCITQEGFRETNHIEHTGADGGPITSATVSSPEDRAQELDRLTALRAEVLTEDLAEETSLS